MAMASGATSHDLPHGVTLRRSDLGGLCVDRGGICLGWLHQQGHADSWRAYRSAKPPRPGVLLGTYDQAEAVTRIVAASEGV